MKVTFEINKLIADCASNFLKYHPELVQKYNEALTNMLTDKERSYAMLGIDFAIHFMVEEIAAKKQETTTFE